jgi:hypothetical protein
MNHATMSKSEGEGTMMLVKTDEIQIEGQTYIAHYSRATTMGGSQRFSCEVILGPGDRIILDGSSLTALESRVTRLVPATLYSRILFARAVAA